MAMQYMVEEAGGPESGHHICGVYPFEVGHDVGMVLEVLPGIDDNGEPNIDGELRCRVILSLLDREHAIEFLENTINILKASLGAEIDGIQTIMNTFDQKD